MTIKKEAVADAKARTEVFYEDDYPLYTRLPVRDMVISVSGDRSFQAAMRL